MDWIAGIIFFLFAFGIWAAIGHGIWVLVATISKAIFGSEPKSDYSKCHSCKAAKGVWRGRCIYCGAAETVALPPSNTLTTEIQGTLKQLDRLWRRGLLSDEEHGRLRAACQRDLERLTGKAPTFEPAPQKQVAPEITYLDRPIAQPAAAAASIQRSEPIEILEAEIIEEPRPAPAPVHPLDRVDAPVSTPTFAPAAPPAPRRALTEVLAAFMQERNIRWGELVSGLLIIGSAAGLVLSLRDELNQWIPYFPAFLFLLATAALHGAGLYTLRKWNLQSTSRGVLTIVLLLVPLNFLAAVLIASDTEERVPMASLAYIAAISIGLVSFGAICWSGAQALVGRAWPPLAISVLGISAIPLAVNRTPLDAAHRVWIAEGGLAAALYIGGILGALALSRSRRLSLRRAQPLLLTMALAGFALLLTNAFLMHKSPGHWQTMVDLTPAGSLIGATIVFAGLFLFRRSGSRETSDLSPRAGVGTLTSSAMAWLATTGTSLAIFGSLVMLAAVVFAWPNPVLLVAVGALSCAALATLAFAQRTAPLHVPAVACAALAMLVGFHLWQGNLPTAVDDYGQRILGTWLLGRSALLLTGVALAVALYGGWFAAKQRTEHAIYLLASAGGLMLLSLGVAVRAGFFGGGDAELMTIVFAIYALAVAIATALYPHRGLAVTAAGLSLLTLVHGLDFNSAIELWLAQNEWLPQRPVLLATLGHSLFITAIAVALFLRRSTRWQAEVVEPLASFACAATLCAGWWAIVVRDEAFAIHAGYVAAIAIVWLAAGALHRVAELFAAGQAVATLAVVYVSLAIAQQQSWWHEFALDPRTIALVLCVLTVWTIAWMLARRFGKGWPALVKLITPPWPAVDEVLLGGLVAAGLGGTIYGVGLGVGDELHLVKDALSKSQLAWLKTFEHPLLWGAVLAMVIGIGIAIWQRWRLVAIVAIGLLGLIASNLVALHFVESVAVASALRWALAAWLIAMTAVLFASRKLALPEQATESWTGLSILGGATPIVILTIIACWCAAQSIAPRGPLADTFFEKLGWTLSYAAPLLAVVGSFLAMALRFRQAAFLPAGSAVWQLLVSLGVVMPVLTTGGDFDARLTVELLQWNIIGGAVYSLVWLGLARWIEEPRYEGPPLLATQLVLVATALLALAGWCAGWLIGIGPLEITTEWLPFGMWPSFLALGLKILAGFVYLHQTKRRELTALHLPLGLIGVTFAAAALQPLDATHPWLSYHALLAGWIACAGLAAVAELVRVPIFATKSGVGSLTTSATAGGALAVVSVLQLFSGWFDPIDAWPTALNLGTLVVLAALGVLRRRQLYAYATVPLTVLAASQWWAHYWWSGLVSAPFDVVATNLLAVTLTCGWWLAVEIYRERMNPAAVSGWRLPTVPNIMTPTLVVIFVLFIGMCYALGLNRYHWSSGALATNPTNVFAMSVFGVYLAAMLWYNRQHAALPSLFVWGGLVALMITERLPLPEHLFLVVGLTALAVYLAIVGVLWQSGAVLANFGRQTGIHEPVVGLERTARWLPMITVLAAAAIAFFDLCFVLGGEERLVRIIAGFGPALLALSLAMQAQLERRTTFIYLSLLSATFAAVLLSWADLPPDGSEAIWLQRLVRLLVVLGSLAVLYAAVLPRVWSHLGDWLTSLWRMAITCGGGAGVALVLILAIEALQFASGDASPLNNAEVGVVAVVLATLGSLLIVIAVSPATQERRMLVASDTGRMGCVYAAQAVFALTFAHLYLARNEWFDGLLKDYWPFIVMAIAFGGVGVSEWFQRRRVRVLAEPFGNTSILLPLLPAIGWWVEAARGTPSTDYALVMFVVGLLYVLVAMTRRSTPSAIAAGVSGNIALWSLMHERGFDFAHHPQFWLIPPAVSALAGSEINRRRLSEEQLTAVRYICMLVIYLSSTSEIFITGLDTLWPPIVLATLAVIGVFVGMALHIRAFIYLGASFVFLSMVTMVWHASRRFEQVWPWWAFGICVGLAMLVFFGMFEKRRGKLAAMMERSKE